jgi:hypothetical protein
MQAAAAAAGSVRDTPRVRGFGASAACVRCPSGSSPDATPPGPTAASRPPATARVRARRGGPDLALADVPDRPAPTLVDVSRWDAPLLGERAGARHQRQGGVRLDLHGATSRRDHRGAACPARRRSVGWRWDRELLDGHRYLPPNALLVLPLPSLTSSVQDPTSPYPACTSQG